MLGARLAAIAAVERNGMSTGLGLLRGRGARELAKSAMASSASRPCPEGLPTVGTTALALASKRPLFREGIVIRRLAAAETLGAVSVVCADKTGTLTKNRMRVEELGLAGDGLVDVTWGDGGRATLRQRGGGAVDADRLADLARIAALDSEAWTRRPRRDRSGQRHQACARRDSAHARRAWTCAPSGGGRGASTSSGARRRARS